MNAGFCVCVGVRTRTLTHTQLIRIIIAESPRRERADLAAGFQESAYVSARINALRADTFSFKRFLELSA